MTASVESLRPGLSADAAAAGAPAPDPELRSAFGQMKRFGEWYLASAQFRAAVRADPAVARQHDLALDEAQVRALLRRDLLTDQADLSSVPELVAAFRAYRREQFVQANRWRHVGTGADPRYHAWRQQQIERCEIEFGLPVNAQVVHAPAAVELQKGCSVGCWFCGVSAPALDGTLRYTPETERLWAGVVAALHEVTGAALASGILYWATDPLDNPDYEQYLAAWAQQVGHVPQTTTAQPGKHMERVRAFVGRSAGAQAGSMRISVLSLPVLRRLFREFTPAELLDTELVMQMPEAATHVARAGRAATAEPGRGAERIETGDDAANSIACVSGFLINMVARSVRMITPCRASEEWPEGYRIVGEGSFADGGELRPLLQEMVAANAPGPLPGQARLRFRGRLRYEPAFDGFDLHAATHKLRFRSLAGLTVIGDSVAAGTGPTVTQILARCARDGVPADAAQATIDLLDRQAVFDDHERLPAVAHSS
jgi:radical SAM family RiPP maturation amino acid epimerase